jgi:hypothetical protein
VQLDNYSGPELGELCRKYDIRNPDTENEVTEPQQFNLMFTSSIGPTGQHPGCGAQSDRSFVFSDDANGASRKTATYALKPHRATF